MTDYAAVLVRLYPGRQWKLDGDDYDGLTMLDGGSKPTKKALDDAYHNVKSELEKEQTDRENAKISALNKLKALGLTDSEIEALLGVSRG